MSLENKINKKPGQPKEVSKATDFMSLLSDAVSDDEEFEKSKEELKNGGNTPENAENIEEVVEEPSAEEQLLENVIPQEDPPTSVEEPPVNKEVVIDTTKQEQEILNTAKEKIATETPAPSSNNVISPFDLIQQLEQQVDEQMAMDIDEEEVIYDEQPEEEQVLSDIVITKSIAELHSRFNDEQMDYINSQEDKSLLVARPDLGIHFNQIQDPYSVSDNIQLNSDIARAKELAEQRRQAEEDDRIRREIEEEEAKRRQIEDLDEDPLEYKKRQIKRKYDEKKSNRKIPDKYPKTYYDPTDKETDEDDGQDYYYFNFENTLRQHNLLWLGKIINIEKIKEKTFDNPKYDKIAQKQHEKALRLNAMTPEEQYDRDRKIRFTQIGIVASIVLLIGAHINFNVIPNKKFDKAMAAMQNARVSQEYIDAKGQFDRLGQRNGATVYARYCEGKSYFEQSEWDYAKECFDSLIPYQNYFPSDISMTELANDCDYNKAIDLQATNNIDKVKEAKTLFGNIYKHKEAASRYSECCYQIAEYYFDIGDYNNAIDSFWIISKTGFKDTDSRMVEIANAMYEEAKEDYNNQDYQSAIDKFEFLATYNFSDSKDQIDQCNYKYATILYDTGDYENARTYFSKNPYYKDAVALAKECIYQNGNKTYNTNPVDSIAIFESVGEFKNAQSVIESNELVLYGRWEIIEKDGIVSNPPVEFSFYKNGKLVSDENIISLAISTDATEYGYKWDGNRFSVGLAGNTYVINIVNNNIDEVTISCTDGNNPHTYTCKRKLSYTEMLRSDRTLNMNSDTEDLDLNQIIQLQIQDYVLLKTDGYVTINGQEVDVNSAKIRIQNAIESEKEGSSEELALPESPQ